MGGARRAVLLLGGWTVCAWGLGAGGLRGGWVDRRAVEVVGLITGKAEEGVDCEEG